LKAKIPNHDVPRLAEPLRFFNEPPTIIIRHVGNKLSISAPDWFKGWIPWEKVLLIDGKEKIQSLGGGSVKSSTRWEGNRIVREWKDENTSVFELSEGRDVLAIADDGKTLTFDSHSTHTFRTTVDGQPYEVEDSTAMRTVLVKKR
jgi:hypothetical protein